VNASPLISLATIGRLDLLLAADHDVLIPAAVADEILAGPAADPASSR
jgi:predicted nucleic acid-binding protein